jgi:hypothetical protein
VTAHSYTINRATASNILWPLYAYIFKCATLMSLAHTTVLHYMLLFSTDRDYHDRGDMPHCTHLYTKQSAAATAAKIAV